MGDPIMWIVDEAHCIFKVFKGKFQAILYIFDRILPLSTKLLKENNI